MTLTVFKDKTRPGTYAYEVHNGFDLVEFGGGYPTYREAEIAGQFGYRALHLANFKHEGSPIQNDYMTLDDILAEIDV
jgi:hypothetical protein